MPAISSLPYQIPQHTSQPPSENRHWSCCHGTHRFGIGTSIRWIHAGTQVQYYYVNVLPATGTNRSPRQLRSSKGLHTNVCSAHLPAIGNRHSAKRQAIAAIYAATANHVATTIPLHLSRLIKLSGTRLAVFSL